MSKDTAELLAAVTTTACSVMVLVGLAVRFVLFPWLKDHLIGPLLARLDSITASVESVTEKVGDVTRDLGIASTMFEGHIERSGDEWGRMWAAITHLQEHLPRRFRLAARKETNPS